MDSFESAGQWWLPELPDLQVVGLLSYSPADGFRLSIPFGFLGDQEFLEPSSSSKRSKAVVQGVLRDGRLVALVNCLVVSTSQNMPGTGHEELHSNLGFVGRTSAAANPVVDRIEVKYDHLRDWVVTHASSVTFTMPEDNRGRSVEYSYKTPDDVILAKDSRRTILLSDSVTASSPTVEGFRLQHDCVLTVELTKALGFDAAMTDYLGPLDAFFTFCLDHAVATKSLRIRLAGETDGWLDVGMAQVTPPTEGKPILQPFMLLSLPALGDRVSDVLSTWLELGGDERRSVSLLTGLIGDRVGLLDLKFLAAAQALEALARVGANEHELDPVEFERRIEAVESAVTDASIRGWLKSKLKYSNQRSAAALLKDLTKDVGGYFELLAPAGQRLLDDIRDNRNFYTHRDDRRVRRVLEGEALYILTQAVIALLKAKTLRLLGFTQGETQSLLEECQNTVQWRFRIAKQYAKPARPNKRFQPTP